MRRYMPVVLIVVCIGLILAAFIGVASRQDDDETAQPTALPSPSPTFTFPTTATTAPPTTTRPAAGTPVQTPPPAGTSVAPQATTPAPTFVPATPPPTPVATADPAGRVQATGPTPRSGGGSLGGGLLVLGGALALRRSALRR